MEAEVVDPEEEKTAHYDYNAVRDKLKALDPCLLYTSPSPRDS